MTTLEILEPTTKDVVLAETYGGEAHSQVRKPNIKYSQERLAHTKKFRVSANEEPKVRA